MRQENSPPDVVQEKPVPKAQAVPVSQTTPSGDAVEQQGSGGETRKPPQSGPAGERAGPGQNVTPHKRPGWVRPLALVIGSIVLIYCVYLGINYMQFSRTHASTDDAYLTTDIVQITPQVSGNIQHVYVSENQQVKAGQLLVDLDSATFQADLAQAKANLEVAVAGAGGAGNSVILTTETGDAQVRQAKGGLAQADSGIGTARADVDRYRAGVANAQANSKSAQQGVTTARAALTAARVLRRRALETVRGFQAQLVTAQAAVRAEEASVVSAQATADKIGRDQQRYAVLYSQDAVSAQQVDLVTAQATSARAQADSARAALAEARSVVVQRQSDVAGAQEAVSAADASIAQAVSQLASAKDAVIAADANVRQSSALVRSAQQSIAAAEAKREQAAGELNQAMTAPRQVSVQRANARTANARILQARAALRTAEINLQRTKIYAPVGGVISKKSAEIGQQVAVGQTLMAVIPNNDVWVEANFKETQLTDVRPGQPADIEVDTFPGHRFTGRVNSLSAGTGATFSLLPPDNATGNFTKVVQRLPVKILFDPDQKGLEELRAGMSVIATIRTK